MTASGAPLEGRKVLVWVHRDAPEGPRVLLLRRAPPWPREWHPVTGHVDPHEALADAAAREAREETGCEPGEIAGLGFSHRFRGAWEGREYEYEEHAFALRVASEACALSHEHDAFEWVSLAEAARRVRFDEHRESLRRLAARLGVEPAW